MFKVARSSANFRRRGPSFPVTVRPTRADVTVAQSIARNSAPAPEQVARALTWGADEKVLLILAAAGWLASRGCSEPLRRAGNHALLVTVAASLLPHGLKHLFDQTRPDRLTVVGHLHGVPFSGKRLDAFPSGHALHMGALASAAGSLPTWSRRAIRAIAVGLSLTRVVVLAHWASDVVAGFLLGAVLERPSGFGPATRVTLQRRTIMPTLEDLKGYAERATGLRRPGKQKAMELARVRKPHTVRFKDDGLVPNHPRWPLIIYRRAVAFDDGQDPAAVIEDLFEVNGWGDTWRNGIYDYVHYHSRIHEALGIARGKGRVRFGGMKGRIFALKAGDVVILPAGTGHQCLSADDEFLVVGAYPPTGNYDECTTVEDRPRALKTIPKVPVPRKDPVYGTGGPLSKLWKGAKWRSM
jgi:uncharacterized protein YjlB/membrane-associated phospholipid phosphatase